jgi:photosystem II stability/assembly factor-like uncharacterized protein
MEHGWVAARIVSPALGVAVLASLLASGAARSGTGVWGPSLGPFGGDVSVLAISPAAPRTLYAASPTHGFFRTTDGARNWHALSAPGESLAAIAVDPRTSSTVYVGTVRIYVGGRVGPTLFRSVDGGRSWQPRSAGLQGASVAQLAIDPKDPRVLYAGTTSDTVRNRERGVFKTADGGRSWHAANRGLGRSADVRALAIDPSDTSTLFVGTSKGVYKSQDAGRSWKAMRSGIGGATVPEIEVHPRKTATVYAVVDYYDEQELFKTTNGGTTWQSSSRGLDADFIYGVAVDPVHQKTVFAATSKGVFKSTDGGGHWRRASTGISSAQVLDLAVSPEGSAIYAATSFHGVFTSTDAGGRWRVANRGLVARSIDAVAVDPRSPLTVYAGSNGDGVFKSTDGGRSWQPWDYGVGLLGTVEALAIDPRRPTTVYAGTWNGVVRSRDGGRSWHAITAGMERDYEAPRVQTIVIDPRSPSILYAGTEYRGVFKSVNGGDSWRAVNNGLGRIDIGELAIDPNQPSSLWAVGWNGNLYKSVDAGERWKRVLLPLEGANAIAIHPKRSPTLYVSTREGILRSSDGGRTWRTTLPGYVGAAFIDPRHTANVYALTGRGVSRSTDGGRTWRPFDRGLTTPYVVSLTIAPTGRVLYAGTYDAGVFDYRLPG